jgi:hypothetical protein
VKMRRHSGQHNPYTTFQQEAAMLSAVLPTMDSKMAFIHPK